MSQQELLKTIPPRVGRTIHDIVQHRGITIPAAILTCALSLTLSLRENPKQTPRQLKNGFYVWQMNWSRAVHQSVRRAANRADEFMVLVEQIHADAGGLRMQKVNVGWDTLSETGIATTLTIRINASTHQMLGQDRLDETEAIIARVIRECVASARTHKVAVSTVQLDYDCPTSKLGTYHKLLASLKDELPGINLSITALPSWLGSREFHKLARNVTYFVLQVHSLEKPCTFENALVLCDVKEVSTHLRLAARVGVPFYLSLPTYGYRLAFNDEGTFAGLSAEGPEPAWSLEHQERLVMSDPVEMASLVSEVRNFRSPTFMGIAWFRLPVDSDSLNWSWPTLEAVMAGREPRTSFSAEIRNPSFNLHELWITNTGDTNIQGRVHVDVNWEGATVRSYDVLGGFCDEETPGTTSVGLTGPTPSLGKPTMAAWYLVGPQSMPHFDGPKVSIVQVVK